MTLPDPTAQQAAAAVATAGQSVALTSGAGCGKTFVLARRFIELVLHSDAQGNPFDGLVALTFTDKASLEMSGRVRGVLLSLLGQSHSVADRQKLADWIAQLPAARISTIHSFCSSLLRRYAVEAGIDPNFHVFPDELLSEPMKQQAAQEAILDAVERGRADVADLLAFQDMPALVRDVVTLIQHPLDWAEAEYADPTATLARWRERQRAALKQQAERFGSDPALRAELAYLAGETCTDPADKLELTRQAMLAAVEQFRQVAAGGGGNFSPPSKPGGAGKAAAWGGKENMVAFRRRLAAFIDALRSLVIYTQSPGQADELAARALAGMMVLAADAQRRYGQAKRRQGLLDFDDLIVLSSRLLGQDEGVRQELRQSLRQMLVDECQDTDSQQLRMLWNLLCDGDIVPPGKLFVVGDPKQSIYRFRGAQAEVFQRLCDRFERHLSLTESFRTHAAGVALVNTVFGRIMPDYEPIQSRRLERPDGPSVEFLLAACPEKASAAQASQAQASALAQRIAAMLGGEKRVWDKQGLAWRPVRPGDIAILFARMTNTLDYERALQQWGVPYHVVAGIGFFRQQEVYDLLNALRAIDNPCDDVAVVGVLRGGMLGLDDNALLHLAQAGKGPYFQRLCDQAVLDSLPLRYRARFAQAGRLLQRLHRQKDALGADGLIEALLAETGFAATLLGQYQGRRRLGNVYQVLDKARAAQQSGLLTLHDFIESFSGLVLSDPRHEQSAVAGQEDDVVRIMTIHKAKGLEWPVVFVPDLNAARRDKSGGLIFRPDWGVTYRGGGEEDADDREPSKCISYQLSRELEKQDLVAEDVRKLYVAMTRHEDYLVLAGADKRAADGDFAADSYIHALDEGLGGQLTAAIDAHAETLDSGQGWQMTLTRLEPRDGPGGKDASSAAATLLERATDGDALADAAAKLAANAALPMVGMIPPTGATGGGVLAATALGDFVYCPMLFHWQHELRLHPARPAARLAGGAGDAAGGNAALAALPAAMLGTFLHRCLELLDFAAAWPDAAAVAALAARVRAEQELTCPLDDLAGELAAALAVLEGNPLRRELASARCRLSELRFVSRQVGVTIAGQIDLLFEDSAGAWHIIDYKSDRIGREGLAAHAARYELQMMLYVQAAQHHLAALRPPRGAGVDARLYFLRTGQVHRFDQPLDGLERRLADVAAQLAASRRKGQYSRHAGGGCRFCPYQSLCHR